MKILRPGVIATEWTKSEHCHHCSAQYEFDVHDLSRPRKGEYTDYMADVSCPACKHVTWVYIPPVIHDFVKQYEKEEKAKCDAGKMNPIVKFMLLFIFFVPLLVLSYGIFFE